MTELENINEYRLAGAPDIQPHSEFETWIIQNAKGEFEWGINDCNTFVVEYMDWLKGSNIIRAVRGKYWDLKGAYRYCKNVRDLNTGLSEEGFSEVETAQDGDIITYTKRGLVCGHIVGFNRAHSIDVESGYMAIPLSSINFSDSFLKIWRYNG